LELRQIPIPGVAIDTDDYILKRIFFPVPRPFRLIPCSGIQKCLIETIKRKTFHLLFEFKPGRSIRACRVVDGCLYNEEDLIVRFTGTNREIFPFMKDFFTQPFFFFRDIWENFLKQKLRIIYDEIMIELTPLANKLHLRIRFSHFLIKRIRVFFHSQKTLYFNFILLSCHILFFTRITKKALIAFPYYIISFCSIQSYFSAYFEAKMYDSCFFGNRKTGLSARCSFLELDGETRPHCRANR